MRHRKGFNHLSRKSAHRKAMFANMASSLIKYKRIKTTTAKAKALRSYVEPLITKSKDDSTHSRRVAFRYLKDKEAVSELFREVSPKILDRPGGYTRILKTGTRLGDNAEMCILELVDYNESMLQGKEETRTKPSRRRRGGKKKPAGTPAETTKAEDAVETVEDESPETTDITADQIPEKEVDQSTRETADKEVEEPADTKKETEPEKGKEKPEAGESKK